MKRALLMFAFVLMSGILALSQEAGAKSEAAGENSQSNRTAGSAQYQNPDVTTSSARTSQSVIRGCLSGSPGNYTVTDQNGMQYQISGDDATLRSMVGREVEVTGVENQTSASGDATSRLANGVQATGVRAVSPTCKKGSAVSSRPVEGDGASPKGTPNSGEPPKQ